MRRLSWYTLSTYVVWLCNTTRTQNIEFKFVERCPPTQTPTQRLKKWIFLFWFPLNWSNKNPQNPEIQPNYEPNDRCGPILNLARTTLKSKYHRPRSITWKVSFLIHFSEIHLNLNSVYDGHRYPLILVLNRLNSNGLNKPWINGVNLQISTVWQTLR